MKKLGFYYKYDEKTKVLRQFKAVDDVVVGVWPDILKESDFNKRHLVAENDVEVDKYLNSDKGAPKSSSSPPTDPAATAAPSSGVSKAPKRKKAPAKRTAKK